MNKKYAILNLIVLVFVVYWNYLSNTGIVEGKTVGTISNQYDNLFTPAGYAFAIWGVIYLALLAFCVNQLVLAFNDLKYNESIAKVGPWLSIANIANAVWIWFWLNEQLAVSVLFMLVILFSLIKVTLRLNLNKEDVPIRVKAFVNWPIGIYLGWIAVATIANVSAWLAGMNWSAVFNELQWTIIMISVAGILNIFFLLKRNMLEFALVGVWAITAISIRHWYDTPLLKWIALTWAVALFLLVISTAFRNRISA
jgi:hypothetical protein